MVMCSASVPSGPATPQHRRQQLAGTSTRMVFTSSRVTLHSSVTPPAQPPYPAAAARLPLRAAPAARLDPGAPCQHQSAAAAAASWAPCLRRSCRTTSAHSSVLPSLPCNSSCLHRKSACTYEHVQCCLSPAAGHPGCVGPQPQQVIKGHWVILEVSRAIFCLHPIKFNNCLRPLKARQGQTQQAPGYLYPN